MKLDVGGSSWWHEERIGDVAVDWVETCKYILLPLCPLFVLRYFGLFKNLISGVDDPALDPADSANRGGEDDEDDGEGEQGEEQQLHGEGEARQDWGGLGLRIFHQVWMGETKLEDMWTKPL